MTKHKWELKRGERVMLSVRAEFTGRPTIIKKVTLILIENTKNKAGLICEGNRISLRH
jgi:hypothetical protein